MPVLEVFLSYNIDKLSHWTFILKHQTHSGSSFSNVTICCFSWSQSKIQLANFVFLCSNKNEQSKDGLEEAQLNSYSPSVLPHEKGREKNNENQTIL